MLLAEGPGLLCQKFCFTSFFKITETFLSVTENEDSWGKIVP